MATYHREISSPRIHDPCQPIFATDRQFRADFIKTETTDEVGKLHANQLGLRCRIPQNCHIISAYGEAI